MSTTAGTEPESEQPAKPGSQRADPPSTDRLRWSESMLLVRQAQGGDRDALNRLLDRYQDRLRRIVRIRLGSLRGQVEDVDILQNTYTIAYQKIDDLELRDQQSILHWMAKIAHFQIRKLQERFGAQKRDRRRERPLEPPSSDGSKTGFNWNEPAGDSQDAPDAGAWRAELRSILDQAVSELPENYRDVVVLRYYSDSTWEQVAQELGLASPDAARQLHQRAWKRLRKQLAPQLPGLF